ncbi:peptidase S11 [Helicobacter monodelphidis]|uniref:D-alanyl-D-alanine carboxypeptidase family protein n=1 Tax=Helicobacter sp. 15-1451 TaxID=2004995 RepID=UPI000DCAECC7|nr:serine hydrolase [Helicobacter sp. 15-1451]RAX59256.1 peptidase S11 [Helicobacter sp. 15-1451]
MRWIVYIWLFLLANGLVWGGISPIVKPFESDISSLIVKDLSSKKVLYAKGGSQRMRPASLTKIMTAILAIESGKMNKVVTITSEATRAVPTKAGLKVGEKFYLRDLVKSALISSANDSATAIGIFVGGSSKRFVQMMNRKARKLGMRETHFTNAVGLDIGNHYSTAKDLLILAEYAIKNRTFNQIVKVNYHAFRPVNHTKRRYIAKTSNRLLKDNKYAVGVKTGYTSKAGPCLIARAKKGKKDIILVMLNSKQKRWESATKILDGILSNGVKVAQNQSARDTQSLDKGRVIRTPY